MVERTDVAAVAAIALLGCGRQREAPRAAAPNGPAAWPVVSAETTVVSSMAVRRS